MSIITSLKIKQNKLITIKNFISMKKTIFSVLAIAAFMVSCSSNEDFAGRASVSTTAPSSVSAYIAQNFPDTKIVSTTTNGSSVTTTLNTGESVTFSTSGSVISYSNNFKAGLKADSIINTSVDTLGHRPDGDGDDPGHGHGKPGGNGGPGHGGPGGQGGGHGHGGPAPDSTHVAGPKGGGHGHDRHFRNEVSVDSLSTAINTYISTNYSGYSVIHAEKDTLCQGAVTEVLVCTTSTEPVKLIFDTAGTFLFKAERINYADVPTLISTAVTANYSTYTVMKRAGKLTLSDGSVQYKVHMELSGVRKSLTFNADGTVACEK